MRAMLPGFQAAGVDVVLIYSVRSPAEAAFGAEFAAAAAAGGVRVIHTVTGAMGPPSLPHSRLLAAGDGCLSDR